MMFPVLQIRHLHCEYLKNQPVLQLQHLDIPAGKLIFIIGKSGIGKSTLIETLGLMNRTIAAHPETSILFTPPDESFKGQRFELCESWNLPNGPLSEFRKRHFSFIFQNTNLMPNFSSGENMMVSLLIQGKRLRDARREVLDVMDRLSLSRDVFDKKPTEISGGQRQRLAFVRAITANFTILFGDEPTGNLDKNTSEELMSVLKEFIRDKGRTGIIVSHDLYLAEKFADIVAPITAEWKTNEAPVGDILPENVIHRSETGEWQNQAGRRLPDPAGFLNDFLRSVHAETTTP